MWHLCSYCFMHIDMLLILQINVLNFVITVTQFICALKRWWSGWWMCSFLPSVRVNFPIFHLPRWWLPTYQCANCWTGVMIDMTECWERARHVGRGITGPIPRTKTKQAFWVVTFKHGKHDYWGTNNNYVSLPDVSWGVSFTFSSTRFS